MRAFAIDKYGKTPLTLREMPMPVVGEHDVLAEVYAASINPVDYKIRDGKLKIILKYSMPLILGNDFSGVITQTGSKVTQYKVGDEIFARVPKDRIGTLAEFVSVDEDAVAIKPNNISFAEAASIPLVGLTNYQALYDVLNLQKGQKILIQAGSGGIGTNAIQLAKNMGAYVATTVSDKGMELVRSLGVDKIINYKTEHFEEILSDYDAVYDTLGGEALEKAFRVIKPGGQIVSISGLPNAAFGRDYGVGMIKTLLFSLISLKLTRLGKKHKVKYTFLLMKHNGEQLGLLSNLIEAGKLKPVIDKIFPFEETPKALEYCESGRAKGKIVVQIK